MKKEDILRVVDSLKLLVIRRTPEILTGLGIAGMTSMTVMAVVVTPKALDKIADIKEEHTEDNDKKAVSKDIVTKVVPLYLPAVITGGLSAYCLISACSVNNKRSAALAAAYTLSESTLKDYQDKVLETFGEKKERAVRDSIAKDKIEKDPVVNHEVILTGTGNVLCLDSISGRYFRSSYEKLRSIENKLNRRLMTEMYLGLNELYYEIGLPCTEQGNLLGFNIDDGLIEFDFSAQLTPEDEGHEPCIVLGYRVGPRYGYGDLH